VGVVELQSVEIALDDTPGVGCESIGKSVQQLLFGQIVDTAVEIGTDRPHGARVRFDGLRSQTLEPKVLEMRLVMALELLVAGDRHAGVTS
jgi:hypothetical protein